MTDNRRYRQDEVREIFGLATRGTAEPKPVARADGLTLADLQGIGREVGLEPGDVARAAATYDARVLASKRRTSLGMPIEVGRIVPLKRALTEIEWEQLVAELRSTFPARGKTSTQGNLREWSNGNLHAFVEPAEGGYRLRLGTFKGNAQSVLALGAAGLLAGAATFGSLLFSGDPGEAILVSSIFAAGGIGALVSNMVRLPRWARDREQQMAHVAARITAIMSAQPDEPREPKDSQQ